MGIKKTDAEKRRLIRKAKAQAAPMMPKHQPAVEMLRKVRTPKQKGRRK